jgi:precorrin-4 methylase
MRESQGVLVETEELDELTRACEDACEDFAAEEAELSELAMDEDAGIEEEEEEEISQLLTGDTTIWSSMGEQATPGINSRSKVFGPAQSHWP